MKDITGTKFNKLTVLSFSHSTPKNTYWLCRCECGNEKVVSLGNLKGSTKSCGCISKSYKDLVGERFERLVVVSFSHKSDKGLYYWNCKCDCGNETKVATGTLNYGKTKSCGCYIRDKNKLSEPSHTKTSEYKCWSGIITRCTNPNCMSYKNYGGRGIKVCDEWFDYKNFIRDMGKKPDSSYTIERIDVNGGYNKENCKWLKMSEQAKNKRNTLKVNIDGVEYNLKDKAKDMGIKYHTFRWRVLNNKAISV